MKSGDHGPLFEALHAGERAKLVKGLKLPWATHNAAIFCSCKQVQKEKVVHIAGDLEVGCSVHQLNIHFLVNSRFSLGLYTPGSPFLAERPL